MNSFKHSIAAALIALSATVAVAQDYPARPIRFVVPAAPGGGSDALARIAGQKLGEQWGQQIVIDNRAGAGGIIGTDIVAKSAPDGYTWLLGYVGTLAIIPSLHKKLPYDPVKDFTPLAMLAIVPFALVVNKEVPAKNIAELIALAKQKPGEIMYGSGGSGGMNHLLGLMLATAAGVKLTHVPYRLGVAAVLIDVMSGRIQLTFGAVSSLIGQVRAGTLRALAVTSAKRSELMKDVPTIAESGFPGFDATSWFGVLARAGTPPAVVKKINGDINRLLAQKDMIGLLANQGMEPYSVRTEQFAQILKTDIAKWAIVVKESGVTID